MSRLCRVTASTRRAIEVAAAVALALAAASPASAAPVAQWHMDETSGTVMRDAVGTNNGTLHNVLVGQSGFLGTAYGFRGSSYKSYVSVPNAPALAPGTSRLTLTIHLRTTKVPSNPDWDMMRKGLSSIAWKVEFQPTGQATCAFRGSKAYAELTAGPALNDDAWHTVVCVKESSYISLTVDGSTYTINKTVGSITNSEQLTIGSRSSSSEFFKGTLDEASVAIGGSS
jgi:hypothetical protein